MLVQGQLPFHQCDRSCTQNSAGYGKNDPEMSVKLHIEPRSLRLLLCALEVDSPQRIYPSSIGTSPIPSSMKDFPLAVLEDDQDGREQDREERDQQAESELAAAVGEGDFL